MTVCRDLRPERTEFYQRHHGPGAELDQPQHHHVLWPQRANVWRRVTSPRRLCDQEADTSSPLEEFGRYGQFHAHGWCGHGGGWRGDDTVNATAATLNAGDRLTGGAGTDTLALSGSGKFRVDQLATFTGFESITLNNSTDATAYVYLGSQSIGVRTYDNGSSPASTVYLGSGAVTFQGGSSSY